ncbi:MAG TPA: outer membrane beta-barrel protein [Longimicrobiaceae bacterium]
MNRLTSALLAAAASVALASGAAAQSALPLSFEVRAGAAIPTGDFAEGLSTGYTVGANAMFNFTPMLGVYAGYTLNSFGFDDDTGLLDDDVSLNVRGFDAGLRATLASGGSFAPFVRGGIVSYKGELSSDDGSFSGDNEIGFEVGAGLDFPLGRQISVTPGVSFTSVDFDDDKVNFFRADVGLRFRL